jgi:hypothetical protein
VGLAGMRGADCRSVDDLPFDPFVSGVGSQDGGLADA